MGPYIWNVPSQCRVRFLFNWIFFFLTLCNWILTIHIFQWHYLPSLYIFVSFNGALHGEEYFLKKWVWWIWIAGDSTRKRDYRKKRERKKRKIKKHMKHGNVVIEKGKYVLLIHHERIRLINCFPIGLCLVIGARGMWSLGDGKTADMGRLIQF